MKRIIAFLAVGTILALAALFGQSFAGNFLFSGKSEKAPAFETVVAKKKNLSSSILATGTVRPIIGAEVKVGARISGKVVRLHANIGDRVEKDQVIAEIEQKDLEAQVAQAEANVRAAEAGMSVVATNDGGGVRINDGQAGIARREIRAR